MPARNGFSLIEMVVALLIGSIISILLYQMLWRALRVSDDASGMMDDYTDILIMKSQLERDITSITIPTTYQSEQSEKDKKKELPQDQKLKITDSKDKKKEKGKEKENEEEKAIFFGTMKDNKLASLSFVSTDALPEVDHPTPQLVQVHYFLRPDKNNPGLFDLMREEKTYAAEKTAKNPSRAYPLISRLSALSITFYYKVYDSGTQKAQLKKISEWGKEQKDKKKATRPFPEFIRFEGNYRSLSAQPSQDTREIPFSYIFPIPVGINLALNALLSERESAQKEKKQKASGGDSQGKGVAA